MLARSQNALRGRWENFWASEQVCVVTLVDRDAVMDKLVYTAANPVQDHLVDRVHHKRSNVETTFSMVKQKFGASVRAKTPAAQVNEVLLKCLCHNLACVVQAIHEVGIEPKFWNRLAAGGR